MKSLLFLVVLFCTTNCFAADVLNQLNARRVKAGLPAFKADATLQAAAERSAQTQAQRGYMHHCCHIGSRYGVGMNGSSDPHGRRFDSCYAFNYSGGYAGAAAVVGSNGQTYYALDISDSPLPTKK